MSNQNPFKTISECEDILTFFKVAKKRIEKIKKRRQSFRKRIEENSQVLSGMLQRIRKKFQSFQKLIDPIDFNKITGSFIAKQDPVGRIQPESFSPTLDIPADTEPEKERLRKENEILKEKIKELQQESNEGDENYEGGSDKGF